jgi:thiamine-phosphate pyrophosphorylase
VPPPGRGARAAGKGCAWVGACLLPAGSPAGERLAAARLYLCTDARQRQGDLADFLDAVLAGGVDIVQLRQKGMEARDELRWLEVFAAAAQRHGRLWAVNDRADLARASGAPVLHLGQDDLPVPVARAIVGDEVLIGRSTHSPAQFDAALAEPGVAYLCAGPTWTTPTKPGRPAAGLDLLRHAATAAGDTPGGPAPVGTGGPASAGPASAGPASAGPASGGPASGGPASAGPASDGGVRPWFSIGGIENLDRLDQVLAAGARRIVVVRAITEAEDPGAAARTLATRLASVPL